MGNGSSTAAPRASAHGNHAALSSVNLRVGILAGSPDLHLVTVLGGEDARPIFWEAATALADALHARGLRVRLALNELARSGTNYLHGIHGLSASAQRNALPHGSVVINSEPIANPEQVRGAVDWPNYLPMLDGMHVWDCSQRNVEAMRRSGIRGLSYAWVPVGYSDRNKRRDASQHHDQDIDVLFYGRINDRRANAVAACRRAGLNVSSMTAGFVGPAREVLLARSKVVLNVGWVDNSVFEHYRVIFLMNNGKAVVTEVHPDENFPTEFTNALAVTTYEDIASTCVQLVKDKAWRAQLEALAPQALKLPIFGQCLDTALATVHGHPQRV